MARVIVVELGDDQEFPAMAARVRDALEATLGDVAGVRVYLGINETADQVLAPFHRERH